MKKITKNNTSFNISDDTIRYEWFQNNYNNWEDYTFKVIDDLFEENTTFIDIGAWVGPILLYVADKSKKVLGIDCDDVAIESLKNNTNCNNFKDKVILEYGALYNRNRKKNAGGGKRLAEWGSSEITILKTSKKTSKQVNGYTIDYLVKKHNINNCGFVKMDIEGGEVLVIDSMKNFFITQKPIFYISTHPHLVTIKQLNNLLLSIFNIFPYVYDINYNLLEKKETIDLFLKNKKDIKNKKTPSNIGHELICMFKKIK